MARFYTLFALVASACVMQTSATPVQRDITSGLGSIIQEAECSSLTKTLDGALKEVVGFLGIIPGASTIVGPLTTASNLLDDLVAQCNTGAAAAPSAAPAAPAVASRDFLSGLEGLFGSFECNPLVQDMMGAVETGVSLLGSSSNPQIQQLVSTINGALSLFKSLSASCSTAAASSKRQIDISGIITGIACNPVVDGIMSALQASSGLLSLLAAGNSEIASLLNGLSTVETVFNSLKSANCPANSRDLFSGGLGGIIQQIECSSATLAIENGLKTFAGLLGEGAQLVPALGPLSAAIDEAITLATAASASCKSS